MGNFSRTTRQSQPGRKSAGAARQAGRQDNTALVRRAQVAPASLRPGDVHAVQRMIGNRATGALLGRLPIQAKLEVGAVNDVHEREADRVAREVVRRTSTPQTLKANAAGALQRAPLAAGIAGVQRQEEDELAMKRDTLQRQEEDELAMKRDTLQRQEEDELAMKRDTLQRQEEDELAMKRESDPSYRNGGALESGLEQSIRQAKGGGKALDRSVMRQMESGFGANFGGVRIHTDATADKLTRSVQAKAFTTGKDIFFKRGEYNPGSSAGKELLAHELTHTVQQGAAGVQRQFRLSGTVQRVVPDVTDYEGVVGSEYQTGTTQYNNSLDNYQRSKTNYEQTHGQNTAGPKITGDMATIFAAVTPNNFDPLNANWQTTIDALFLETLRHAETNWSYSAGGTAGGSMFLTGEGNCGQFATTFVYLVNSLAAKFNVGGLKAGIESKAGDLITDPIANFTNAGVGPANSLAGQNHPTGNVYATIEQVDQPIVGNYLNINRARFTNHTWAVVDLPGAGQRTYDVLSKYMGGHQDPTPVAGCGYTFKRAPGNPPGFGGGNYMIRNAVWQQIVELETYANQIRDVDRSLNAVQTMVDEMARTGYRRGWLGAILSGWNQDRKVTRQQVTTILKIKRADPTLLDTAIEVLAVASPGPSGRLREIRDLNIPSVAIQNAWARRKD